MKSSLTFIFFICLCCSPILHFGQNTGDGDDEKVRQLVKRHKSVNKDKQSMPGYRIQIYYGSSRHEAVVLKAGFLRNYPEKSVYLIYQQPNFKVRIGDFKTKLEAKGFIKLLKEEFPSAFIVSDNIRLPELD